MPIHLKLLFASLFWGTTPSVGRILAEYHAPFVAVFGRFLVASLVLVGFCAVARDLPRVPRKLWPRLVVLGATGVFLHNGLMFKGLESTEATTASILLGLIAIQVLLLDLVLYRRRPDGLAVLGVLLGFLGTAFVITGGDLRRVFEIGLGAGEALILLSGLCWAVYSVVGREVLESLSPLFVTAAASCIGLVFLAPFLFARPEVTLAVFSDPRALLFVFLLGFVGSALGFLWYYQAVESYGAVNAALYINLVPIFGVVSAAILVREEPGPAVLLGGLMVFAGITLVNRPAFLRPRVAARED